MWPLPNPEIPLQMILVSEEVTGKSFQIEKPAALSPSRRVF